MIETKNLREYLHIVNVLIELLFQPLVSFLNLEMEILKYISYIPLGLFYNFEYILTSKFLHKKI